MAVADQATAGVDRDATKSRVWGTALECFAHRGQSGFAAFQQASALAAFREAEEFVRNNLRNGEAVMHFDAVKTAGAKSGRGESLFDSLPGDGEIWGVLVIEGQPVGRVPKTGQTDGTAPR
jgi:hypothetical protein